jgi:hypothetical protein
MDDNSFDKMFSFLKGALEKDPHDETLKNLIGLLIQKKSAYDIEMLKTKKEIAINNQNNYFKYCMQDMYFRQQWNLFSNGYINSSGNYTFPQIQIDNSIE